MVVQAFNPGRQISGVQGLLGLAPGQPKLCSEALSKRTNSLRSTNVMNVIRTWWWEGTGLPFSVQCTGLCSLRTWGRPSHWEDRLHPSSQVDTSFALEPSACQSRVEHILGEVGHWAFYCLGLNWLFSSHPLPLGFKGDSCMAIESFTAPPHSGAALALDFSKQGYLSFDLWTAPGARPRSSSLYTV